MQKGTLKADILLLITAIIWGSAFVAQRVGMDYVGPFTFNGVRFALGSLFLLPFIAATRKGRRSNGENRSSLHPRTIFSASILAGFVLFLGASLQQVGIVYTTAGKAGFITGMYVILVPIIGIHWGQKTSTGTWIGAVLAIVGLYLLSVTGDFTISKGDLFVLIGAFFWAGHVLLLGWLSPKMDSLVLASTQFAVCSVRFCRHRRVAYPERGPVNAESCGLRPYAGWNAGVATGGFLFLGKTKALTQRTQRYRLRHCRRVSQRNSKVTKSAETSFSRRAAEIAEKIKNLIYRHSTYFACSAVRQAHRPERSRRRP